MVRLEMQIAASGDLDLSAVTCKSDRNAPQRASACYGGSPLCRTNLWI